MKKDSMIRKVQNSKFLRLLKIQWPIHAMVLPGIIFVVIFSYIPMYGVLAAFKDFSLAEGFWNSPWAVAADGSADVLKYFKQFLSDARFWDAMVNTLVINLLGLVFSFPMPIIFSLLLVELTNAKYRKLVQTISYLPYFISWAVFSGITIKLLDPTTGALGQLLVSAGMIDEGYYILNHPENIYAVVIISGLIKGLGWGSIVYVASLTSVSEELVESALLEGANRLQKMYYISFPTIKGTVAIYLIFAVSGVLGSNFDQMYLLKNGMNESKTEVIDTFVYEIGIKSMNISYSTAVGLMRSVLAFILLVSANFASKKMSGHGIY